MCRLIIYMIPQPKITKMHPIIIVDPLEDQFCETFFSYSSQKKYQNFIQFLLSLMKEL